MDTGNKPKQNVPDMYQVDFEDRFKVLMGVAPEGEEITFSEETEDEKLNISFVPEAGFEPAKPPQPPDPKSGVFTNFTTPA